MFSHPSASVFAPPIRQATLTVACTVFVFVQWSDFSALAAGGLSPNQFIETEEHSGYRGIWYSIGYVPDAYRFKYSGGLGTYCAKHSPFAVYSEEANKTFFVYGGSTEANEKQLVHMVSYFDHDTGRVPRPRFLLDKQTDDAHDNPVLSIDDDGYIWVFSTSHGRERPSYIHRSVTPYSIERFERIDAVHATADGDEPLNNFSYMQVWRTPSHGFTAFFTRYGDPAARTSMFMTSRDGRRWSRWRRIAAIHDGHYQVSAVHGDVAATSFNYHPNGKGLDSRTNLYFAQTKDGGRTWSDATGESVKVPLTSPENPCLVYDFESEGRNVYLKDLVFDDSGRPVILVVTSDGAAPGPKNDPRIWELFRWDGGDWQRTRITESDSNYDMGSLYIEGDEWKLIAPTDRGPQAYNPGGEMAIWHSSDRGENWERIGSLTAASELNHTYARRPVGAHPDFYALWADGHGRRVSKSRLYFCNKDGKVFALPAAIDGAFAAPELVAAESAIGPQRERVARKSR